MKYWMALITILGVAPCVLAVPQDPPTENDYGTGQDALVPYWRNGAPGYAPTRNVLIMPDNPNFVHDHAHNSGGEKVGHVHFQKDYGSVFAAPHGTVHATEGATFWEKRYDVFDPKPTPSGTPTTKNNCHGYAYHQYKNANAIAEYWVEQASKYFNELTKVADPGPNEAAAVRKDDRCHAWDQTTGAQRHAWIINVVPAGGTSAIEIKWKNLESQIFTWTHPDFCTNKCPVAGDTKEYYLYFSIYRRPQ